MARHRPLGTTPHREVIEQAVEWLVRLNGSYSTDNDRHACRQWRAADPSHELAWQRVTGMQGTLRQGLASADPGAAQNALERASLALGRRKTLKLSLGLGGVGVLTWMAARSPQAEYWRADYRTATGDQRDVMLADGTQIRLNTHSALDIAYDEQVRGILLRRGEIMVSSGHDPLGRPLRVSTPLGQVVPIGTRFTVRWEPDAAPLGVAVAVLDGKVELQSRTNGQHILLRAGQHARFDHATIGVPMANTAATAAWIEGLLIAERMSLNDFVAELSRYRPGVLSCDPALGHLSVSGGFPLIDTDKVLDMLTRILPVRVVYRTRYWGAIVPS